MDFTNAPHWESTKRTLGNGLDVILCPVRRSPMVSVNLWYDVGSQTEKNGEKGFAHLFEHLMFEGSKHFPGDFFKHLQKYGAGVNGSTSSDRTNYYEDIPADILELALAMESDRMGHLVESLDDSRLETQKGVVTNEYRQNYSNQPYGMVSQIMAESLYPTGHPYSWTTIGLMEEVNAASRDQVVAFFERYYVPANASLCIAGDIDPEQAFDMAESYFGSFRSGLRCPVPQVAENTLAESRKIELRDNVSLERIYLTWPTVRQLTEDEPPLSLLGEILTSGRSSRLYQELVVKLQLAQDVSAGQWSRELSGQFSVVVTLRPGASAEQVRATIDRTLTDISNDGPIADELQRMIRRRWSGYLFSLEKLGGFGGVADRLNAFNNFTGDPGRLWIDAMRYRRVEAADIARVTKHYLSGRPRLEIQVLPQKKVASVPDRAAGVKIGPPRANRFAEPKVLKITDQVTAWLLPRRDWPVVAGAIAARPATAFMGETGSGLAQLHSSTVMEGTARHSGNKLAEAIESLGSSISPHLDWDGYHLMYHSTAEGLTETWDVASEIWRESEFPEGDWQRQRDRLVISQKSEVDRLESLASRAFLLGLFGREHPFGRPIGGYPDGLAGLTRNQLIEMRNRLNRPADLALIVAGDFNESQILKQAEIFAAGLGQPSQADSVDISGFVASEKSGSRLIVVNKPGSLQAVIRLGQSGMMANDADRDALGLWNLSLGGLFTSRLNHVLREVKGLTYGVRSGFDIRRDMAGSFVIASSVQHDRCAEAIAAARQEVYELLGERLLTKDELEDARRNRLEATAREDETCSQAANRLVELWLAGLGPQYSNDQIERYKTLTLGEVQAAAHRRINPSNWLTVLVADWSKVASDVSAIGFDEITVLAPGDLLI